MRICGNYNTLDLARSSSFKKDEEKILKSGNRRIILLVNNVVYLLLCGEKLPEKYKNHQLKGNYSGYYECHITPDLLLIYKIKDNTLNLARLGSHSELFR